MAGRFVILEFDDRKSAEAFVNFHQRHEKMTSRGKVMAMFMKPDKFCDCPTKRRQNATNWAKGSRSGLYLCKVCKKPSVHHQQGIIERLKYVFGNNLLEQ